MSLSYELVESFELSVMANAEEQEAQTSISLSAFCHPNRAQNNGERQGGLA